MASILDETGSPVNLFRFEPLAARLFQPTPWPSPWPTGFDSLTREGTALAIEEPPPPRRPRPETATPFTDRDAVMRTITPCAREIVRLLETVQDNPDAAQKRHVLLGPLGRGVEIRPGALAKRSERRARKSPDRRPYSRDSYERALRILDQLGIVRRVFRRGGRASAFELGTDPETWSRARELLQVSCGNHAGLLQQSHPQNALEDSALRRFSPDGSNGSDGSDRKDTPQPPIENPVEGGARFRSKGERRILREGARHPEPTPAPSRSDQLARLESLAAEASREEGLDPDELQKAYLDARDKGENPPRYFEGALRRLRLKRDRRARYALDEEKRETAPAPAREYAEPDNSALERMRWLAEDKRRHPEKYRLPKDLKTV